MNSPTDSAAFSDTLANDTASRGKRSRGKKFWADDTTEMTDVAAPTFKLREPIAPASPATPAAALVLASRAATLAWCARAPASIKASTVRSPELNQISCNWL